MIGLIIGGICFMCGYWIIMDILISLRDTHVYNWRITILFFEFWLGGMTSIIYGTHCWIQILNDKKWKIIAVLKQLFIVSLVLFIGYTFVSVKYTERLGENPWELSLIASGYGIIMVSCIIYIIFYFIKVEDDKCDSMTRNIIAGLMIIGSILAAIGYWAGFSDPSYHSYNSWNTSYCLLLMGLCVFNGLDIRDDTNNTDYDSVPKQEN